jgi:hypothetical protein
VKWAGEHLVVRRASHECVVNLKTARTIGIELSVQGVSI